MTTGTLKTQGTELFVIDTVSATDPAVLKMSCPTGITGLGGPASQIEDTCLDTTTDKTYQRGLGEPGQVNVPFNFIPIAASHQTLYALKDAGQVLSWLIGFSDGTAAPTLDSDGAFVAPDGDDRTSVQFQGYVSDVTIDIATNEIVKGTLVIQRSGAVVWNWPTVSA